MSGGMDRSSYSEQTERRINPTALQPRTVPIEERVNQIAAGFRDIVKVASEPGSGMSAEKAGKIGFYLGQQLGEMQRALALIVAKHVPLGGAFSFDMEIPGDNGAPPPFQPPVTAATGAAQVPPSFVPPLPRAPHPAAAATPPGLKPIGRIVGRKPGEPVEPVFGPDETKTVSEAAPDPFNDCQFLEPEADK